MLTSQVGEDVGVSGSGAAWTALSIQKISIRNEIMMIRLLNTRIGIGIGIGNWYWYQ